MTKPWEDHKATIVGLYKSKGWHLDAVKAYMEVTHEFKASTRAYRCQFKKWNVTKYIRHARNSRTAQRRNAATRASSDAWSPTYSHAMGRVSTQHGDGLDLARSGLQVPLPGSKPLFDERLTPPSTSRPHFCLEDSSTGYGLMQNNTLDGANGTTPSSTTAAHLPTPMATSTSQSSYASTICDSNSPHNTAYSSSTASSGSSMARNNFIYTNRQVAAKDRQAGHQSLVADNDVYKRQTEQSLYQTPRFGPEHMQPYYQQSKQDWNTDDHQKSKHLSPDSAQAPGGGLTTVPVSSAYASSFPYSAGNVPSDLVAQLPVPAHNSPAPNAALTLGGLDTDLAWSGSLLASLRDARSGGGGVARPQVTISSEEHMSTIPQAQQPQQPQHRQHFPNSGVQKAAHQHGQQFTLSPYQHQQQPRHQGPYHAPTHQSNVDQTRQIHQQHQQQQQLRPPRLHRTLSLPGSTEASLMATTLSSSGPDGSPEPSVGNMVPSLTLQSSFLPFSAVSSASAPEQTGESSTYHRLSVPFLFSSFEGDEQQRSST